MKNKVKIETPENQINIDERELSYWSNKFGIAKGELRKVIKRGGTFTEAIEKYLQKIKFATA